MKKVNILRILGIDPGIAIVGFGVIEYDNMNFKVIDYGAITSPAHTPVPSRLKMIYDDLTYVIEKYKPDEMAIEAPFFGSVEFQYDGDDEGEEFFIGIAEIKLDNELDVTLEGFGFDETS